MIDKAVILAAGLGNRISAVSKTTPKPLLPIDGDAGTTTFLDWHVDALRARGVREIYVVGNTVTANAKIRSADRVTAWILNPTEDLSTSGSAHSAWFAWNARDILDGKSRVVLMDADIVYDPSVFDLFDDGTPRSKTLVCSSFRETNEEVLVFGDPPAFHGKGLLGTNLVAGLPCIGEATGIVLFEPGDHALVRAITEWLMRYSTAKTRSEHEDITQRMMSLKKMNAVSFDDRLFMEVDTPEEYRVLVEEMWPRLR